MVASKEGVALELIKSHALEAGIRAVYRLISPRETDQGEPIKLLEVNRAISTGFCKWPAGNW